MVSVYISYFILSIDLEFLMSQLDHRKLLTECNLKSAFDTFSNVRI